MNAFFIVPTSVKSAIQNIFSTHPPMEQRIERLQQLESQLQAALSGFPRRRPRAAKKLKGVAPDRLFAMTTAYVTMETGLGMKSAGSAGIVFQPLATADFDQILKDAEELLHGTAEETGSTLESADDEFGYRWTCCAIPTSRISWCP